VTRRSAAYPFKRISLLHASLRHPFEDSRTSLLDISTHYTYTYKVEPGMGWDALWKESGVTGGKIVAYWISGGAGSKELLLRRMSTGLLPDNGTDPHTSSFIIPGYLHTPESAVLIRVLSDGQLPDDLLGAQDSGILWEAKFPIEVRGDGGFLRVKFAAAPTDMGLQAGPGEVKYSRDRGYEIVVYHAHIPDELRDCGAVVHGPIAILLERVLRDAYSHYKDLKQSSDSDEAELGMLETILDRSQTGRKSPRTLLDREDADGPGLDLANWCWELAGALAEKQTNTWLETSDFMAHRGGDRQS
jgi:hypothetical protein